MVHLRHLRHSEAGRRIAWIDRMGRDQVGGDAKYFNGMARWPLAALIHSQTRLPAQRSAHTLIGIKDYKGDRLSMSG